MLIWRIEAHSVPGRSAPLAWLLRWPAWMFDWPLGSESDRSGRGCSRCTARAPWERGWDPSESSKFKVYYTKIDQLWTHEQQTLTSCSFNFWKLFDSTWFGEQKEMKWGFRNRFILSIQWLIISDYSRIATPICKHLVQIASYWLHSACMRFQPKSWLLRHLLSIRISTRISIWISLLGIPIL